MTQKVLAGQVGVSRQTMNAIENGRHAPTVSVAFRIADVFGLTVDQLFSLDYEGKPARHAKLTPTAIDRPRVTIAETNGFALKGDPTEEDVDMKTRLRNLQNVIG